VHRAVLRRSYRGVVQGAHVGIDYLEHLTDADLELLLSAAGRPRSAASLCREPELVPAMFDRPEVFEAVFGHEAVAFGPMVAVSPFLAFAVAVHRAAAELASTGYVAERSGTRTKVPVFDAPQLAEFLHAPDRRLFLCELLAPFARVASGRYWVRRGGRWHPRRFSELDPVQLAGLIDSMRVRSRNGPVPTDGSVTRPCSSPVSSRTTRETTPSVRLTLAGCCTRPACRARSIETWSPHRRSSCSSTSAPPATAGPAPRLQSGQRG